MQSVDGGESWLLVGLISLLDPPREDSATTIHRAQELGVVVRPNFILYFSHPHNPLMTSMAKQEHLDGKWTPILRISPKTRASSSSSSLLGPSYH